MMILRWFLLAGFEMACLTCYVECRVTVYVATSPVAPLKRSALHRRSPEPHAMQSHRLGLLRATNGPQPGAFSSFQDYWSRDLEPKIARATIGLEKLLLIATNEKKPQREREAAWNGARRVAAEFPTHVHEHMINGLHLYSKGVKETKRYAALYERVSPAWLKAEDVLNSVSPTKRAPKGMSNQECSAALTSSKA